MDDVSKLGTFAGQRIGNFFLFHLFGTDILLAPMSLVVLHGFCVDCQLWQLCPVCLLLGCSSPERSYRTSAAVTTCETSASYEELLPVNPTAPSPVASLLWQAKVSVSAAMGTSHLKVAACAALGNF